MRDALMFWSRIAKGFVALVIFISAQGCAGEPSEVMMFREALRDPEMQSLARESFSNERLAVACAVLSLHWRSGRILGSTPSNPGESGVALLMHGMAETALFALDYFPEEQIHGLTQQTLQQFEESQEFREGVSGLCSDAMIEPLGFVMYRNNLFQRQQ